MKFKLNLKFRLTFWYLLITTATLLFFSGLAYFLLANGLLQKDILPENLRIIQIEPGENGDIRIKTISDISNNFWEDRQHELIFSTELNGSHLPKANEPFIISLPEGEIQINSSLLFTPENRSYAKVQLQVYNVTNSPGIYNFVIFTQLGNAISAPLYLFRRTLFIVIPVTLVVSGILWFLLVKYFLNPLGMLVGVTRKITEEDLGKRIEVLRNDEIGELAASMNLMFDRFKNAFEREKAFTSDASHELRLPLSIIKGEATLALQKEKDKEEYQKLLNTIINETNRMSLMLKRLSFLSRDNDSVPLSLEKINLTEFIQDITEDVRPLFEDKQIQIRLNSNDNLIITGEAVLLKELFFNLLDNALKYTAPGGEVAVNISTNADHACIAVKDNGRGISQEHLPYIFNRFYQVHKTGEGMGLGLAICQRIVELHKGRIEVSSESGKGSIFRVIMPLGK